MASSPLGFSVSARQLNVPTKSSRDVVRGVVRVERARGIKRVTFVFPRRSRRRDERLPGPPGWLDSEAVGRFPRTWDGPGHEASWLRPSRRDGRRSGSHRTALLARCSTGIAEKRATGRRRRPRDTKRAAGFGPGSPGAACRVPRRLKGTLTDGLACTTIAMTDLGGAGATDWATQARRSGGRQLTGRERRAARGPSRGPT